MQLGMGPCKLSIVLIPHILTHPLLEDNYDGDTVMSGMKIDLHSLAGLLASLKTSNNNRKIMRP